MLFEHHPLFWSSSQWFILWVLQHRWSQNFWYFNDTSG